MGLTVHYSLHADAENADDARRLVQRLHQAALDLPFAEVGDITERTGDQLRFEDAQDDEVKWLLVQASQWIKTATGYSQVQPSYLIAFTAWPGPGCEVANVGLCRYPAAELDGWHWRSFCKTQYASNLADGGIENFLRCHLTVIKLLDHARQLNLLAEVKDEGGFWEGRDVAALTETVGQWNQHVASIVGYCKDQFRADFLAPISRFPDFERLEAKGRQAAPKAVVLRAGDRIRLLAMRDDPDPIQVGQLGTVDAVRRCAEAGSIWHQIDVAWDNGRTLMLVAPPDRFEIVEAPRP